MLKKLFVLIFGLLVGAGIAYAVISRPALLSIEKELHLTSPVSSSSSHKKIIGFLPYWLAQKAQADYSNYINTLTYFSLTIDTDGSIQKLVNDTEGEPGWIALNTGKMDSFLSTAKEKKLDLSLLVFAGDEDSISQLMSDPVPHANTLVQNVVPIMKKYGFSDLNIDIESSKDASEEARMHFTQFIQTVKKGLTENKAGTLTIDISPTAFVRKYLIDPDGVIPYTDNLVVMAYDYHFPGSQVTGPVSPLSGANVVSEFDIEAGIKQALRTIPKEKIILGIPLYGYEWETINNTPRSGVIPGTGDIASNDRVETLLNSCASCSAQFDTVAQEPYLVYKDESTGSYHQIFYPDKQSTQADLSFADKYNLAGIAMWALGYEGSSILQPIETYKNMHN